MYFEAIEYENDCIGLLLLFGVFSMPYLLYFAFECNATAIGLKEYNVVIYF